MINPKIITLSNFLRKEGMIVSIRSTITAANIWEKYHETFNDEEIKESLKCIYVKNREDIHKFDLIYNRLFSKKIERKTKRQKQEPRQKYDNTSNNEIKSQKSNPNTEYLENQELIENRKQKKVINDKLMKESIVLLDNNDRRVFDICQRLSKKIANQRSKRKKRSHSHNINMPNTIRYNLKNGGHLVKLIHQKPPKKRQNKYFSVILVVHVNG